MCGRYVLESRLSHWVDQSTDELVMSTAIITTEPCEALKEVHDRMPVMIPKEEWSNWLDPKNQDIPNLRNYIVSSDKVKFHAVGFGVSGVGKNRVDSEDLINPVGTTSNE